MRAGYRVRVKETIWRSIDVVAGPGSTGEHAAIAEVMGAAPGTGKITNRRRDITGCEELFAPPSAGGPKF